MLKQKRSELLRLLFIISMLALTVGVVMVYSAKVDNSAQTSFPKFVKGSNDTTFNFSISVDAGSNAVKRVDVNRPAAFTVVNCPVDVPAGWTCEKVSSTVLSFTEAVTGIAAGATTNFSVNATASGTSGNSSWLIDTYENTGGTLAVNSSKFNVTIDADAPLIYNSSMNLSDGNVTMLNASTLAHGTGFVKLQDLTFNVTITDPAYDNVINASIYYRNTTTIGQNVTFPPYPSAADSYNNTIRLTSQDPATGRYNGTIPASLLSNGTRIFFTIVANDSVGNVNVTNLTTSTFNFSVDGAAPVLSYPNFTDSIDAADDNITTSSATHNFTITAKDDGGSGVSRVDLAVNVSGTLQYVNMSQVGSSTTWDYTGTLQSLAVPSGDGNYTVWFRAYDNVSNLNENSVSMNVLVDDPDFIVTVQSNVTRNFTTSNATQINVTVILNANLNQTSGNVTINGPDGFRWNMTLRSSTAIWPGVNDTRSIVYQSTWFSSFTSGANVLNRTYSNLSDLGCGVQGIGEGIPDDGETCAIQITWDDLFGRRNSTNITITVDNVSASVTNITVNATGGAVQVVRSGSIINFTLSATNNIINVTIHNATLGGQLANGTLMTSIGSNNYSAIKSVASLCGPSEGICTVNFSVVDKALNINRSGISGAKAQLASTKFIVDNGAPLVSNFLINGSGNGTAGPEVVAGTGSARVYRSDISLNITFNVTDQASSVTRVNMGNSTLINATTLSAAINSSVLSPDSYYNVSTLAGFGCTANVEADCILTVNASDNESIDGLRNSNTSVNLTFRVDDLKPRVVNFTTNLTYNHRVTSATTLINFTANVTDANIVNVSVANTTIIPMNRSSAATTSNSTSVVWTVATTLAALGCAAGDGNCTVTVYANDSAGNVNASEWLSVNLDSSTIETTDAYNLSPQTAANGADAIDDPSPTLWINLTTNSLCKYATTDVPYASMTAMSGDGTPNHWVTLSDQIDGSYHYEFRCVNNLGVEPNGVFPMDIDFVINTTGKWNITVGATGALSAKYDYFWSANKWYSTSMLANTNVLATTSLSGGTFNVTNVLASLVSANPSGTDNNLTILYANNGGTWTSYVPGAASGNDFTNFTSDTAIYYFNLSTSNERLEIN